MRKLTILYLLSVTLIACNPNKIKNRDSIQTIMMSEILKLESKKILLSEISSDFRYFIPEAKPESYFTLMGIKYIGPDIVILYEKRTQQLTAFKPNGKFIGKIGEIGSGPKEYKFFTDVFVFPELNEIHVFIARQKRILRFSFGLEFLGEIKLDSAPTEIHIYKNKYYLCAYNDNDIKAVKGKDLIIRDPISFKELKVLQQIEPEIHKDHPDLMIDETCRLFSCRDTLYYARASDGNVIIYKIFDDVVSPYLNLDFNSLGTSYTNGGMLLINQTMMFANYLIIGFQFDSQIARGYYNLRTKELSNFEIINDLDKGLNFYPMGVCDDNCYFSDDLKINYFTEFWKSSELSNEYNNINCLYPDKEKWLKDTIPISIEGNPWIMIVCPEK
jgi:hypothetical protein